MDPAQAQDEVMFDTAVRKLNHRNIKACNASSASR